MKDKMLTTYDNPINPFENFSLWWKFDLRLGHDCCGTLAREALTSDVFSDEQNRKAIHDAMDYIVSKEPLIYKIVTKDDYN